jgi:hypothetical protein
MSNPLGILLPMSNLYWLQVFYRICMLYFANRGQIKSYNAKETTEASDHLFQINYGALKFHYNRHF